MSVTRILLTLTRHKYIWLQKITSMLSQKTTLRMSVLLAVHCSLPPACWDNICGRPASSDTHRHHRMMISWFCIAPLRKPGNDVSDAVDLITFSLLAITYAAGKSAVKRATVEYAMCMRSKCCTIYCIVHIQALHCLADYVMQERSSLASTCSAVVIE